MGTVLVLVHSPLTGPSVWWPLAGELRKAGQDVLVPQLEEDGEPGTPLWRRHAAAVADALGDGPYTLVAHSGAGPLLPAAADAAGRGASGYVFVDAGLPAGGRTRLELLAAELPEAAARLRPHLEAGGRFPEWTSTDLADEIPDPAWRFRVVSELRPRPLAFFTEPIGVPSGWPDAPCGYLRFSAAYERPARRARALGWPVEVLPGSHFQLVVEPQRVAEVLLRLVGRLRPRRRRRRR
jgi:pimeloyl-ACP methyl ester carboxylesterase